MSDSNWDYLFDPDRYADRLPGYVAHCMRCIKGEEKTSETTLLTIRGDIYHNFKEFFLLLERRCLSLIEIITWLNNYKKMTILPDETKEERTISGLCAVGTMLDTYYERGERPPKTFMLKLGKQVEKLPPDVQRAYKSELSPPRVYILD